MGGRGSASGLAAVSSSKDYKNSYDIEMENATSFEGHYALQPDTTKESLGYQMYVHQDVTGNSLISDTRKEMEELQRALKDANRDGSAYGMSKDAIAGMKQAIKEKIYLHKQAIAKMVDARPEFEKYSKQAFAGNKKGKANKGWM